MNTVVFFIQKSSVLLWHKDEQSYWYNFIFNSLNHCMPSELFNMLHSAKMAYTLLRLWNCHTSKLIQVVDKSFLLQSSRNAEQLPLGLKNESGVIFIFLYFSIFLLSDGYVISYSASSRIYCYCFPSGSSYNVFYFFFSLRIWFADLKNWLKTILLTRQSQFGK